MSEQQPVTPQDISPKVPMPNDSNPQPASTVEVVQKTPTMTTTTTTTIPAEEKKTEPDKPRFQQYFEDAVGFIWEMLSTIILTIRAIIFSVVKTFYVVLPSPAHTSMTDDKYNRQLGEQLANIVRGLDLEPYQKAAIEMNWLGQLSWANGRATRERDANELIRWWQIILGVLIPVLINTVPPEGWAPTLFSTFASFAGIFVAVLTAIYQFRRPEERWRHYRILAERYQNELWNYITLSGETYHPFQAARDYKGAFIKFHERMTDLKEEDITKFFGEVVTSSTGNTQQQNQQQTQPSDIMG